MMHPTMKAKPLLFLFLVAAGATWVLWPEPEPEPVPFEDADTGMTRLQTEEMMRSIGYVQ
jgi:hypothetical protein